MRTRRGSRFASNRGATVIEYALGLAMLAIPITLGVASIEDTQGSHLESEGQRIGNPDGLALAAVATTLEPIPTTSTPASSSSTSTSTSTTSSSTSSTSSTSSVPLPPTTYTNLGTVHLANMQSLETNQANPSRWAATVLITVRDGDGDLVAGAEVTGSWAPSGNNNPTCTTESTGQCTVSQVDMHRTGADTVPQATFTMAAITHPELTYAPADDQVPLSITVLQP
jgi:hypothetical protein